MENKRKKAQRDNLNKCILYVFIGGVPLFSHSEEF